MSSKDYFGDPLDEQYFISGIIFTLISTLTLKVALEQKERNRDAQCYIVLLLFCGSLCRTVWLFVKPTGETDGLAICNRLGILFQFTAILWMIYLWWVVLNVCKEYIHHLFRCLILFCWIFLLITAMYCYGSHCLMYIISLVFIAILSLIIVASVLIHGLIISEQLSQRKSDVSEQLQLQRKCLKELQFVCTVIMFCFVLRAFCFCIHPFHHWFNVTEGSWSDFFYPWAFYQFPEAIPNLVILNAFSNSDSTIGAMRHLVFRFVPKMRPTLVVRQGASTTSALFEDFSADIEDDL